MKIYDRVVINIDSGQVVEERSFDYHGPVARCDGPGGGGGGGGTGGVGGNTGAEGPGFGGIGGPAPAGPGSGSGSSGPSVSGGGWGSSPHGNPAGVVGSTADAYGGTSSGFGPGATSGNAGLGPSAFATTGPLGFSPSSTISAEADEGEQAATPTSQSSISAFAGAAAGKTGPPPTPARADTSQISFFGDDFGLSQSEQAAAEALADDPSYGIGTDTSPFSGPPSGWGGGWGDSPHGNPHGVFGETSDAYGGVSRGFTSRGTDVGHVSPSTTLSASEQNAAQALADFAQGKSDDTTSNVGIASSQMSTPQGTVAFGNTGAPLSEAATVVDWAGRNSLLGKTLDAAGNFLASSMLGFIPFPGNLIGKFAVANATPLLGGASLGDPTGPYGGIGPAGPTAEDLQEMTGPPMPTPEPEPKPKPKPVQTAPLPSASAPGPPTYTEPEPPEAVEPDTTPVVVEPMPVFGWRRSQASPSEIDARNARNAARREGMLARQRENEIAALQGLIDTKPSPPYGRAYGLNIKPERFFNEPSALERATGSQARKRLRSPRTG